MGEAPILRISEGDQVVIIVEGTESVGETMHILVACEGDLVTFSMSDDFGTA